MRKITESHKARKATEWEKENARIAARPLRRTAHNRLALNDERRSRHQVTALISRLKEGLSLCAVGTPPSDQEFCAVALAVYRSTSPDKRDTLIHGLREASAAY